MKFRHLLTLFSALFLIFLTSCAGAFKLPPITGSVYYRDSETGGKAGVEIINGRALPWLRVPLRDSETGELNGMVDIHAGK